MLTKRPDEMLTRDHSEIDALDGQIMDLLTSGESEALYKAIDFFWARLAIHIRAEHLHLFPTITEALHLLDATEAAAIKDKIEKLHEDHNFFMREMIGAIKTMRQIVDDPDSDELSRLGEVNERLENVRRRMIVHNKTEESEIYPLADRLLVADAARMLRYKMKRELDNLPPRFVVTPK